MVQISGMSCLWGVAKHSEVCNDETCKLSHSCFLAKNIVEGNK